jgi:pentatricopeptide repeat domain-containing protein 1
MVILDCIVAGLTKLVSQMSREGHWAKSLEVYESLDAVAVRPDTTITNAAISACDKGGQWEKALQIFK